MGERKQERLPFGNLQASGLEALAGASPIALNVIVEASGTITRRPGISEWCPDEVNAEGVIGIYETVGGTVFAVGGVTPPRRIYRVSETGVADLSGTPASNLAGAGRPVFVETAALLAIAGGQDIQKVDLTTLVSSRLGGGPPLASHVIANSSRLLANSPYTQTGFVFYSATSADPSGNEDWTTAISTGSFSAEARPDPVVALWENSNEVCAFGSTSFQSFGPTQVAAEPFGTVTSKEIGCVAPYSVVKIDEQFGWLDHLRRFVISDGRSVTVISDPIQQTLHGMATVSDCFGYRVTMGRLDCFVWTFPSDGRTFSFQKGGGWSQWTSGGVTQFRGLAAAKLRSADTVLVGIDGTVAQFDFDAADDLGTQIDAHVVTGFLDHGTDNRKSVKKLQFSFRRGTDTGVTEAPVALLSWRDNLGAWSPPVSLSLGTTGETYPVVTLYSTGGVFRRRQWKLEFSGPETFSLISATIEYSVEGN